MLRLQKVNRRRLSDRCGIGFELAEGLAEGFAEL